MSTNPWEQQLIVINIKEGPKVLARAMDKYPPDMTLVHLFDDIIAAQSMSAQLSWDDIVEVS